MPGLIPLSQPAPLQSDLCIDLLSESSFPPSLPAGMQNASQEIWYVTPDDRLPGEPILEILRIADGAYYRLSYSDGFEFLVNGTGTTIAASWSEPNTIEDAATVLLGPVLGFALRQRGITCLHSSAVVIDNRAIAFLGDAGAGKSTTAAAFARGGFPVLTDDVVAILERGNSLLVPAAYPYLCLWPDSVEFLYGSPEALPRLSPTWEKRHLPFAAQESQFHREPLPLGVIYVLGERRADSRAPFIETVSAQDAFVTLIANTFANTIIDKTMRAREFELLHRVVSTVPVRRLIFHEDPARLERICDLVCEDFRQTLRGRAAGQSV